MLKENIDMSINKIIIDTTAVIVSVFAVIGTVLSQVIGDATRFYELLGWALSLTFPFIISSIVSVLLIAYNKSMSLDWVQKFQNFSIGVYIFGWVYIIYSVYLWSPQYFVKTLGMQVGIAVIIVLLALLVFGGNSIVNSIRQKFEDWNKQKLKSKKLKDKKNKQNLNPPKHVQLLNLRALKK